MSTALIQSVSNAYDSRPLGMAWRERGMAGQMDELEHLAGALIDAVSAGDAGQTNEALAGLYPVIKRAVLKVCKHMPNCIPADQDEADILQDVATRMQTKGPRTRGTTARATLLAWVKTTTTRHLIDLGRRQSREREHAATEKLSADPSNVIRLLKKGSSQAQLEARSTLNAMYEHLEAVYPRGAEFMRAGGFANLPAETAEALGTSRANVDQIRKRTVDHLKRFAESEGLKP